MTVIDALSNNDQMFNGNLEEYLGGGEHLLPPEYHGDPLNSNGCLCFYHFAWNLLEKLRQIGFNDVTAHFYYSSQFGYLGINQLVFSARKC
jgi:hypothetical protein